jgi:hypothetical protein
MKLIKGSAKHDGGKVRRDKRDMEVREKAKRTRIKP